MTTSNWKENGRICVGLLCLAAAFLFVQPPALNAQESAPAREMPALSSPSPAPGSGSGPDGAGGASTDRDLRRLSIEDLMGIEVRTVESASRYRQKVSEAPASVTIITANDIRKFGYRTLADALRDVRGFWTTYDRAVEHLGVRGFGRLGDYNTRILLLVDGHRINDAVYDSAPIGTDFPLDVDLIERIEVTRGPGSSLYGSNAFFGVVNIITRTAGEVGGTELSAEAASRDTYKARLSYGKQGQDGPSFLASATGYTSAGDRLYFREFDPGNPLSDPRATNSGCADHGDYDHSWSGYAKFEKSGFLLSSAYIERTKGIPTASFGSDFNEPRNRTVDAHGYVDLRYSGRSAAGAEYVLRAYYDRYQHRSDRLYAGVLNRDRAIGDWYGGEARLTARPLPSHRVIAGAESEIRGRQDQQNADLDPAGTVYLDEHHRSRTWAVYVQDEITVSPVFLLYAGLRHDHESTFGGTTSPRLSAVLKPVERGTLKLLYGKAFRAPTVYELYYSDSRTSFSNPGLSPEEIETYELVYEQDFGRGLRTTISRYNYAIRNLITRTYDSLGNSSFQNEERAAATGTELGVRKKWESGADCRVSYAHQRAEDPNTGELLTNAPQDLARLNVVIPLVADRLWTGIEEQYTGSRLSQSRRKVRGYAVTNLTASGRSRTGALEASLSIYNILNERYADPVSGDLFPLDTVQQDGRSLRLKITYVF